MTDPIKNFAKVTLLVGIDADDVTITLTTGHGSKLPNPATEGAFNLVIWNSTDYPDSADDPSVEILRCTGRSGDILTATRAQEGTSAATHDTAGKTYNMILAFTKKMLDDLNTRMLPLRATPTGTIDGSNTNFAVPASAWHLLIKNGAVMSLGATEDYTLSSNPNTTLAYTSPPSLNSTHSFIYIPT